MTNAGTNQHDLMAVISKFSELLITESIKVELINHFGGYTMFVMRVNGHLSTMSRHVNSTNGTACARAFKATTHHKCVTQMCSLDGVDPHTSGSVF